MASESHYDHNAGAGLGEPVADFIAEVQADLNNHVLSPRVFNDVDIHRVELEKIFNRSWVFVGHVTEIESPGDYVLRYIGEDQFIMVRDADGEIRLLLNNCTHRASPVCRADKGNTSHFRCPYHGWIFKNSGDWNGAPHRPRAYRKLDAANWGLRRAPHVDTYQGFIFASLDPDAIPLTEFLGDMCWYLDVLFGTSPRGMRVAGDPQRWIVHANWKSGADNFVGDGYHVPSAHRSVGELGLLPGIDESIGNGFQVALDGGHGLLMGKDLLPPPIGGIMGFPPQVESLFDLDQFQPDQRKYLEDGYGTLGFTIFPNLSLIRTPSPSSNGLPVMYTALRQWQPRGPDKFELWNWPLIWDGAPDDYNQECYDTAIRNFGPSGLFEQDDTVAWSGGPIAGKSPFARREMKLNYQMGTEGMSDYETRADWVGPGVASTTLYGEFNQIQWWRRWQQEMAS